MKQVIQKRRENNDLQIDERLNKSINMIVRNVLEKLKDPRAVPSLVIRDAILEGVKLMKYHK